MSIMGVRSTTMRVARLGVPRLRAWFFFSISGLRFRAIGRFAKIYGHEFIKLGEQVRMGDFCWIEAVSTYGGKRYTPSLSIGSGTAISDLTHISCIEKISVGNDCLIGSKVYIGDHSHGNLVMDGAERSTPPVKRALGAAAPIEIGERVWIGDGAVILAGSRIAKESIIGANSVVRLKVDRPALIAGVPARVIRYFRDDMNVETGNSHEKDS